MKKEMIKMAEEGIEDYQCHCGRSFKRSTTFKRHQEVAHSTSTSHKCLECGKTFGHANTLTMHMSVHERKETFTRLVVKPSVRQTRSSSRNNSVSDVTALEEREVVQNNTKNHKFVNGKDEKENQREPKSTPVKRTFEKSQNIKEQLNGNACVVALGEKPSKVARVSKEPDSSSDRKNSGIGSAGIDCVDSIDKTLKKLVNNQGNKSDNQNTCNVIATKRVDGVCINGDLSDALGGQEGGIDKQKDRTVPEDNCSSVQQSQRPRRHHHNNNQAPNQPQQLLAPQVGPQPMVGRACKRRQASASPSRGLPSPSSKPTQSPSPPTTTPLSNSNENTADDSPPEADGEGQTSCPIKTPPVDENESSSSSSATHGKVCNESNPGSGEGSNPPGERDPPTATKFPSEAAAAAAVASQADGHTTTITTTITTPLPTTPQSNTLSIQSQQQQAAKQKAGKKGAQHSTIVSLLAAAPINCRLATSATPSSHIPTHLQQQAPGQNTRKSLSFNHKHGFVISPNKTRHNGLITRKPHGEKPLLVNNHVGSVVETVKTTPPFLSSLPYNTQQGSIKSELTLLAQCTNTGINTNNTNIPNITHPNLGCVKVLDTIGCGSGLENVVSTSSKPNLTHTSIAVAKNEDSLSAEALSNILENPNLTSVKTNLDANNIGIESILNNNNIDLKSLSEDSLSKIAESVLCLPQSDNLELYPSFDGIITQEQLDLSEKSIILPREALIGDNECVFINQNGVPISSQEQVFGIQTLADGTKQFVLLSGGGSTAIALEIESESELLDTVFADCVGINDGLPLEGVNYDGEEALSETERPLHHSSSTGAPPNGQTEQLVNGVSHLTQPGYAGGQPEVRGGSREDQGVSITRKSGRDRKENVHWKTLLTGEDYDKVLDSFVNAKAINPGGRSSDGQCKVIVTNQESSSTTISTSPGCIVSRTSGSIRPLATTTTTPKPGTVASDQLGDPKGVAMIPTMVIKQEPTDYGYASSDSNVKMEFDENSGHQMSHMDHLTLGGHQRLKRGPVRKLRSGMAGAAGSNGLRHVNTTTFDCLVCGKAFISEKYLSMHISLHDTSKIEPGVTQPETGLIEVLNGGEIEAIQSQEMKIKHLDEGEVYRPPDMHNPKMNNSNNDTMLPVSVERISSSVDHVFKQQQQQQQLPVNSSNKKPTAAVNGSNDSSSTTSNNSSKKPAKLQTDGGWTCSLCNKTFAHNSGYKNHMRTHSNERPYVCPICDIGFKEKYHLKKHNLFIHSNELPEKCRVCGKRFKDSTAVRAHERIHSDARPFACRQCGKTFKTSECLWHHEHRSKTCGLALGEIIAQERLVRRRRRFPKSNSPQQNQPNSPASGSDTNHDNASNSPMQVEQDQGMIDAYLWHQQQQQQVMQHQHESQQQPQPHLHQQQQQMCNDGMSNEDHYMPPISHYLPSTNDMNAIQKVSSQVSKHSTIANQLHSSVQPLHSEVTTALHQTPLPPPPNQPQVPLCVEQHNMSPGHMSEEDHLSPEHLTMGIPLKDLHCLSTGPQHGDIVLEEMMNSQGMYSSNHAGVKQERTDGFGYSMDEEDENWVTTNMDKIMNDKGEDLIDSKVDAILSNMASSMSSAFGMLGSDPIDSPPMPDFTDNKEYRCRICRKVYTDLSAYQRHSKVHTEERPFLCLKCDIGFKMKVHLKKHNLYVHSNDYPCECQYCGKKFKDSSAVKLHERTHSDSRPFGCTGCGKAFKTRENLWGHQHRGKCVAARKRPDQDDGGYDDSSTAKASVLNNKGAYVHATANTNGVTAQACVNNSQVTAHASIENNQLTAHATFNNSQFTAHASLTNNQVTAHASIVTGNGTAQASVSNVRPQDTFTFPDANVSSDSHLITTMTNSKSMNGSIPSTTTTPGSNYGGCSPGLSRGLVAKSLLTPPLNTTGSAQNGAQARGSSQQQNLSPRAGSLPVSTSTALPPQEGTIPLMVTAMNTATPASSLSPTDDKGIDSASGKWPTLKEFLSKGIGPPTPVPTWTGVQGQNKISQQQIVNNNLPECKSLLTGEYPALKERLSKTFFNNVPPGTSSNNKNVNSQHQQQSNVCNSYPSSPASSNLSAPSYSGQTTPTAATSPYGKGRDSVSPFSDLSPGGSSNGPIPSFQSTFFKRSNPHPFHGFANNPLLRGEDPNIPIIYWDDENDQRPPSAAWNSPDSDSMFHDISESVLTQL